MQLAQISIRVKNPHAARREFAGGEVIKIPGDQRGCPAATAAAEWCRPGIS
jgi:hypothetical protein